jgi:hypothetical protein
LEVGPIVSNGIGLFAQSHIVIAAIIGTRTGLPDGVVAASARLARVRPSAEGIARRTST